MTQFSIFIGFDPRGNEQAAFHVARYSMTRHLSRHVPIQGLVLQFLRQRGLYIRPTSKRDNPVPGGRPILWDDISGAAMSTEFAISRFLVPYLCGYQGYALFTDGDVLARDDIMKMLTPRLRDHRHALWCVKHDYRPAAERKMDGQIQTKYARKNWSSVMLFNCAHPAHKALDLKLVNTLPGRDLHRLCWLMDDEVGELEPEWNYLAGVSDKSLTPKLIHYTEGTPSMAGYEDCEYADLWKRELKLCLGQK